MKKVTRKLNILQTLYSTKLHLTATDFKISNANQYLGELESQRLIERYWVKNEGDTPFKLAYVSDDTRERAEKYLNTLQDVKLKKDEVQESRN